MKLCSPTSKNVDSCASTPKREEKRITSRLVTYICSILFSFSFISPHFCFFLGLSPRFFLSKKLIFQLFILFHLSCISLFSSFPFISFFFSSLFIQSLVRIFFISFRLSLSLSLSLSRSRSSS